MGSRAKKAGFSKKASVSPSSLDYIIRLEMKYPVIKFLRSYIVSVNC